MRSCLFSFKMDQLVTSLWQSNPTWSPSCDSPTLIIKSKTYRVKYSLLLDHLKVVAIVCWLVGDIFLTQQVNVLLNPRSPPILFFLWRVPFFFYYFKHEIIFTQMPFTVFCVTRTAWVGISILLLYCLCSPVLLLRRPELWNVSYLPVFLSCNYTARKSKKFTVGSKFFQ